MSASDIAHADGDLVVFQQAKVVVTGVLIALVGMMQAGQTSAFVGRSLIDQPTIRRENTS